MQNVSSTTSYRAELDGAFHLLKHIKLCGMKSTEVDQWCKNLLAAHSIDEDFLSPKGMGEPKADTILGVHQLKKDLPNVNECKHVYAHQDTQKAKTPAEAKLEQKGVMIDCKIKRVTTQADREIDYTYSGNET